MRVAHFDCFSGISGDMTLGALLDSGVDVEEIRNKLATLGLPITLRAEKIRKGGFAATQVRIEAPHEHKHRHLHHIEEILKAGQLSEKQADLALRIFRKLAEAEAAVHGISIEKVHFHEVGALDSIADIAGVAIGLDMLGVDTISCTPIPTGSGSVNCEHGLMPIPAPATAELLKGIPLRSSSVESELTTPTGAAILATVVKEWTKSPSITVEKIGIGAGQRDLKEQPNILRLLVGTTELKEDAGLDADEVVILETNLDDIPPEVIGYCYDLLFQAGAVDVYSTPIFMKKNRPGFMLSVLAPQQIVAKVEEIIFRETGTFGIRRTTMQRRKLHREGHSLETKWGLVQGKLGWREGQSAIFTPEYEDCARVARESGIPLQAVYAEVRKVYLDNKEPIPKSPAPSKENK